MQFEFDGAVYHTGSSVVIGKIRRMVKLLCQAGPELKEKVTKEKAPVKLTKSKEEKVSESA